VKLRVVIALFDIGQSARLYSVRLPDQVKPETARFFDRMMTDIRFQPNSRLTKNLRTIWEWLDRIARLDGAQERFFRPREGQGLALPIDKGMLRLYCYRFDDQALLLCGGGIKESQTAQESPDCIAHFTLMNSVISELKRKRITSHQLPAKAGDVLHLDITLPVNDVN
jgi:hypothetical protein